MRLTIPDEILDPYQALADQAGVSLEQIVSQHLERFAEVAPTDRHFVLSGELLDRVEACTGRLPARSARELVAKVENVAAGISFGHIRLDFSPGQLRELEYRAARQGRSVKALVEETIRSMEGLFFHQLGTAAPKSDPPATKAS